ncbi:DUF2085 domain-containing protein [Methanosphaera sp. ISO3-F5]|uniref:DUF2085 domain-containing protein n=1 Tax=Methanosphaera sp. ISO3-F5 TaxID=1452353 RepID=UPI002B259A30|nr:DUF2085 domain-containing protein [Methanosphaera sp. ISO3-F5]WQH63832.1 DUF2085 domain-containing protein [Methanosphaera sp. ISO3-F5]
MKYLCHQRPDRSFFFRGHQFPVCARCTGLIIGTIGYCIYSFLVPVYYSYNLLIFAILIQLPYIIDGTTQYMGLRESNNYLRLITGIIGAIGLVITARIFKIIIMQLI